MVPVVHESEFPIRAAGRCLAVAAVVFALLLPALRGGEVEERRIHAGTRLFRALLAADSDLTKKTVAANQILIVFVYADDRARADELAKRFIEEAKERDKIRGLSIVTEVTNDPAFAAYDKRVPAGIFVVEPPRKPALASIVRYAIQRHVIAYSPFEGDVEHGILGGLSVEAQVRPYINRATLAASQISLKSFFLEVSKVYE